MSDKVRNLFSSVAASYDINNKILSFGVDALWRREAVKISGAKSGDKVLDCACGTGDLTIAFKKAVGDSGDVIGTDFCKDMLDFAPCKARKEHVDITWEVADVTDLPYSDDTFDIASIAFGIRNTDDPVAGLREMARVVRPGGKVVVLEFGQPDGLIAPFYNFYSTYILPRVGGLISGDENAYQYLNKTAASFPCGVNFIEKMIEAEGFNHSYFEKLTQGICYLYVGVVREKK